MPFALLTIGILLIVVGFQNTYKAFGNQLVVDFAGSSSFLVYSLAIIAVGSIGYVKQLEGFSRALLGLIVLALFIGAVNKGGFFNNLTSGLTSGDTATTDPIGGALPANSSGASSGGGSSSGGGFGSVLGAITSFL